MTNVLPKVAGLQVNGVVYQYTTVKKPEDNMLVHVQNLNAQGPGYIFRSTDDWSKLPGNTIQKSVPVANIPSEFWGNGSIEVEGEGDVENATVIYTYQYDPCFDPQSNPICPGYKIPVPTIETTEIIDPLDDEFVQKDLQRKARLEDEEEQDRERRRAASANAEKRRDRLEIALSAVNAALMTADVEAKAADFFALAEIPQPYVVATIPGGVYNESVRLIDSKIPDNVQGLRQNWAQQLLHEKMVNLQYESLTQGN